MHSNPQSFVSFVSQYGKETPKGITSSIFMNHKSFVKLQKEKKKLKEELQKHAILDMFVKEENKELKIQST